jgi:hypothetical protein
MQAAANLAELDRVDRQRPRDTAHLAEHWQHEQFLHLFERARAQLDAAMAEDAPGVRCV